MKYVKPMVSICCTTYNHEKYIKDALDSFLMQKTNFPIEILIHDDASTDKTADIIRKYENKYPDIIKPIYQKENQYSKGVKINHRFNYQRAKGKYIALCEGDDYWTDPYKLQRQVEYMQKHSECSMCFHSAEIVNRNKKKVGINKPYTINCISSAEDIIMGGGGFITTNSMVYRKKLMENPPDFYFNAPVGDYPLAIYLALEGKIYYFNEIMSAYRKNVKESWSHRMMKNDDLFKKVYKKKIIMLEEINKYSDYKYNEILIFMIKKVNYRYFQKYCKYKEMKSKDFIEIYNDLSIIHKMYINFGIFFPNTTKYLIKIKRQISLWRIK
jgi:glycosyltransferase involved in cell wall biosynthesis